jgi:hypothetical protein
MSRIGLSKLGLGAMIRELGGNKDSVEAWNASVGKTISSVKIDPEANGGDGALLFTFSDKSRLELSDQARSCCESRFLSTDDDLSHHVGYDLLDAEVIHAKESEYGEDSDEESFLIVTTSAGQFTVVAHNRHNGYYGGISIFARIPDDRTL